MNAAIAVRHTAEERRDEILRAAVARFGATGLHGTSTEIIARDVGVSQPYLFRLFGTKKGLFMAAVEWGFEATIDAFHSASEGADGQHDAFKRMGDAYVELISDRRYLDLQMQAYASTDDPEIRDLVQRCFGRLVMEIIEHTDASPAQLVAFLGRGMLLNVATSMGVSKDTEGWATMIREGCIDGFEED